MKTARALFLTVVLAAGAGVTPCEEGGGTVKGADLSLLEEVRRAAARVEKLRGEKFPVPPVAVRASGESLRAVAADRTGKTVASSRLEVRGRAWADIGLGSEQSPSLLLSRLAVDLGRVVLDIERMRLLVAGDVLPPADFNPEEAGDEATALLLATGVRPDEPMVAHALTHLLQVSRDDRDWMAGTTDALLASSALAEGEANLVAVIYLFHAMGLEKDVLELGLGPDEVLEGGLVPEALRSGSGVERGLLEFVFIDGFERLSGELRDGGWSAVDRCISSSRTTRDILHADATPIKAGVIAAPELTLPERYVLRDRDVLGEQAIVTMISTMTGKDDLALRAGDGWAGDTLFRWESNDGVDGVTAWITRWTDAEEAGDFLFAYRKALVSRFGSPFATTASEGEWKMGHGARTIRLIRQGSEVLVVAGPVKPPEQVDDQPSGQSTSSDI